MRSHDAYVALVTGATDGLGHAVATSLAAVGMTVLVHGRDDKRGAVAVAAIRQATGNDRVHWYRADFASLRDVRMLTDKISTDYEYLNLLVNNAGIGTWLPGEGHRCESEDGIELRFAVNYLAGAVLARRLLPALLRSGQARIVNVTSSAQEAIDFNDVMLTRDYDGRQAYGQSKLAQVMLTFDLSNELRAADVTANCLHPGSFLPTKMVLAAGRVPRTPLGSGVAATLRLLTDPELTWVSGEYFDGVQPARAHEQAYHAVTRARLRNITAHLGGL